MKHLNYARTFKSVYRIPELPKLPKLPPKILRGPLKQQIDLLKMASIFIGMVLYTILSFTFRFAPNSFVLFGIVFPIPYLFFIYVITSYIIDINFFKELEIERNQLDQDYFLQINELQPSLRRFILQAKRRNFFLFRQVSEFALQNGLSVLHEDVDTLYPKISFSLDQKTLSTFYPPPFNYWKKVFKEYLQS